MTCERCGGDGGFESMPYGYNHVNGEPLTHWARCIACDGKGECWAELLPIACDDHDWQEHDVYGENCAKCEAWRDPAQNGK